MPASRIVTQLMGWRGVRWLLVGMFGLVLSSCGGSEAEPTPVPSPTATVAAPALTPTPVPDPAVGEVVWASALEPDTNAPVAPVTSFSSDAPALYATIRVTNLRPETVITASWTYNDTPLDGATRAAVLQSGFEAGWLEFHLMRNPGAEAWPAGRYAVTILLDGDVAQKAEVEVTAR